MQETYDEIWREIASGIRLHLSADAFQRWFAAIELVQADAMALTFQVPNTIYQFWIEDNFLKLVHSVVLSVLGSPRQIKFKVGENGKSTVAASPPPEPLPMAPPETYSAGSSNLGMNPRNRFDSFVVGPSNQFVHAA